MTEDERLAAEGWIKHDGNGMPVPFGQTVDLIFRSGLIRYNEVAEAWDWREDGITHFRIYSTGRDDALPDTLTLRDDIAIAVLNGLLAREGWSDHMASMSYSIADVMLAERARK